MMNRIQFQSGMSLNDFLEEYGEEEQCQEALENARWPQGFVCPACSSASFCRVMHGRVKTFQCNRCHKQVTLTGGTIFHSTKLPLKIWFQAIYFLSQTKTSISAMELMRRLGVSYATAWRMKHKLMQVMCEREQSRQLTRRVELDDAYLGGERSGGKAGRGSENKVPFVAAVETNDQGHPIHVVYSRVKSFSRKEIEAWALRSLTPSAVVVSDGLACFRGVTSIGCTHQPMVVGTRRKSTTMPCFRWINTLLGNLKTSIDGTYHGFDFNKYPDRYLAETQYRFNRRYDLAGLFRRLLFAGAQTGPRTEEWLRLAEDER
jgi:transposase-like protein